MSEEADGEEMVEDKTLSRRKFAQLLGVGVAGVAIGASSASVLLPEKEKEKIVEVERDVEMSEYKSYSNLDPDAVAERAYNAYYEAGCCYGAFEGIIGELRETKGHPFDLVPSKMMVYGKGGGMGWGTLCGALNGAGAAMCMVSDDYGDMFTELMGYYSETTLPIYEPSTPRTDMTMVSSRSDSPLCHASVSKWCVASGHGADAPERKERCARLTADTARKTAIMLNEAAAGTFAATYALPADAIECLDCHGDGKAENNVHGKGICGPCHEPHEIG